MTAPQYTYGAAPGEPPPAVATPSEFSVRLTARCAEWRSKNPTRAENLRRFVASLMGKPLRSTLSDEAVAAMCAPLEERIIATIYGWPSTQTEYDEQQGDR